VTPGLAKATKFALEHGFRSHINARDRDGNTALYVLLRHVGRTVKTAVQYDYDAEVRESIQLLLAHGANPNAPNRAGESALHALFADGARRPLYVVRHGQVRRLKPTLHEISAVLEILLGHGADPAQRSSPLYATPLHCAAHIFESLQPDMFVVVKTALQQLFLQLCRDGGPACVNAVDAFGVPVFVQLLTASRRWLTAGGGGSAQGGGGASSFSRTFFQFLARVLQHFLRHGLNPNASLAILRARSVGGGGVGGRTVLASSYFREIVAFVVAPVAGADAQFYDDARLLLVVLAQRGGNPNTATFTASSVGADGLLLPAVGSDDTSISSLLAHVLLDRQQDSLAVAGAVATVDFFYKTLCQAKLRELADGIQSYVSSRAETRGGSSTLAPASRSVLLRLTTNVPRPLRLLCRIAVADSLQWRLARGCPFLPLPRTLLHYLANFDL